MRRFFNTGTNEKVAQFIRNNCQYYVNALGDPVKKGVYLEFPPSGYPFHNFRVHYTGESKFLGKTYAMIVEAKVKPGKKDYSNQDTELFYSGFMVKGMPFFKPMKGKKKEKPRDVSLVNRLNGNYHLLGICRNLDLEHLRILYDHQEEIWKIQARPYGGSVVEFMLPPMRYNVVLPKGHTEGMLAVMKEIADVLQDS